VTWLDENNCYLWRATARSVFWRGKQRWRMAAWTWMCLPRCETICAACRRLILWKGCGVLWTARRGGMNGQRGHICMHRIRHGVARAGGDGQHQYRRRIMAENQKRIISSERIRGAGRLPRAASSPWRAHSSSWRGGTSGERWRRTIAADGVVALRNAGRQSWA